MNRVDADTRAYVVPGRVELVGKHVDYGGGRSLTCAVDRAIRVRATALGEPVLKVGDGGRRGRVVMPLSGDARAGWPKWGTYVAAVARRFARDFPHARRGVQVRLRSDLPPSAGLSSSSALIVALGTALVDANRMDEDPAWRAAVPDLLARAEYFAAMETGAPFGAFPGDEGVGVRGGAQDPIAIVCGADHAATQFSYIPARMERRVAWPAEMALVIGVSGVKATKTGNARRQYNRASDAMRWMVGQWNAQTQRHDLTVAAALAADTAASTVFERIARTGGDGFKCEIIVPGFGDALGRCDYDALGRIVDRSQELAERALGNQVRETIHLQRSARTHGAVAASAFGAGFGGAVWAMVREADAVGFLEGWQASYEAAFPLRAPKAQWLVTRPGPPAREVAPGDAA
ncbi:MAG: galactokinase [Gemmatimonadetes bacterium]|nr:galactokinase [Gemmatimonadota bacterium]